jgi:hypothetical protein
VPVGHDVPHSLGRVLAEREVRSRPLVVHDVGAKHPAEMLLVEDDYMVQTLPAERPDTRSA